MMYGETKKEKEINQFSRIPERPQMSFIIIRNDRTTANFE